MGRVRLGKACARVLPHPQRTHQQVCILVLLPARETAVACSRQLAYRNLPCWVSLGTADHVTKSMLCRHKGSKHQGLLTQGPPKSARRVQAASKMHRGAGGLGLGLGATMQAHLPPGTALVLASVHNSSLAGATTR